MEQYNNNVHTTASQRRQLPMIVNAQYIEINTVSFYYVYFGGIFFCKPNFSYIDIYSRIIRFFFYLWSFLKTIS